MIGRMQRRAFIKGGALAALAVRTQGESRVAASPGAMLKLACTPPVLQTPAPTSMGVAWGVSTLSTGFVDVSRKPDLTEPQRFFTGSGGLKSLDGVALCARLTGLQPNTRYFYRVGTIPVDFQGAYKIFPGDPEVGRIYSFRTAGASADSSFAVINDTHENAKSFELLAARLNEVDAAVTVWNGDACNSFDTLEQMREILLNPCEAEFAARRPVVFVPGNHDFRGIAARELPRFMMTRDPVERGSRHWMLERNFAVRQGEIALIGLDTGEDKPDWREEWGRLAQFEPYRARQTEWLAEALERPEIKSAPYIVAFCHIPLFDADPNANPGDTPKVCEYKHNFAIWNRWCHDNWGPVLHQHGAQAVITAHTHRFRCDAPDAQRSWAHIVNGSGCEPPPHGHLTVLDGRVSGGELVISIKNVISGKILGTFSFKPRKV